MSLATASPLLFSRLKGETAGKHRQLEDSLAPLTHFQSHAAYRSYLLHAAAFYRATEAELAGQNWMAIGLDFEARRKVTLLEQDLAALGVQPDDRATPSELLGVTGMPFAIGCLYVLEGATLGGQVISRHVRTMGVTPTSGGAFFAGYGPRTGEMWKAFQHAAIEACPQPAQIDAAVAGACRTFDVFAGWMSHWKASL